MEYSGQAAGMQGSSSKLAPWRLRPRMLSRPARYIQPAEPVYHVQPPRPAWAGVAYTAPAVAYGFVSLDVGGAPRVLEGFQRVKPLHRLVPFAERGHRHDRPHRGVRVL